MNVADELRESVKAYMSCSCPLDHCPMHTSWKAADRIEQLERHLEAAEHWAETRREAIESLERERDEARQPGYAKAAMLGMADEIAQLKQQLDEALLAARQCCEIIEGADHRAACMDGPVGHVRDTMTDKEWRRLYKTLKRASGEKQQ